MSEEQDESSGEKAMKYRIGVFRSMGSIERDNVRMIEGDKERVRTGERRRGCESRGERVDSRDKRKMIRESC